MFLFLFFLFCLFVNALFGCDERDESEWNGLVTLVRIFLALENRYKVS